jgi:putative Mn2+ efflux pump MntP
LIALAGSINSTGSPVSATVSGSNIILRAVTTGVDTNYAVTVTEGVSTN